MIFLPPPPDTVADALSIAIGGPTKAAANWLRHNEIPFQDFELRREFDLPLYQLEGSVKRAELISVSRHLRCQLPPCCFHVRSGRFNCKRWRGKNPNDAHVLALFVKPEALQQESLEFDHVYGAFSYARFYCRANTAIIMEVQCDVFGQLTSNRAKQLTRHWHRLTLMCVHGILRRSMPLPATVLIPASGYQLQRFPNLSPFLAKRVYEQLPEDFGYQPVPDLNERIEPVNSPKRIGRAWSATLKDGALSPLESLFENHMEILKRNRYLAALEVLNLGKRDFVGRCLTVQSLQS